MFARFAPALRALLAAVCCAATINSASAAIFVFAGTSTDGHPVSALAHFTFNSLTDTIAVTLKNTTPTTLDSGELFTAIDFNLGGLAPTLVSASGIQREVDAVGAYSDTGVPQALSWSVTGGGGGTYSLNFTPTAKDAIIGPPTAGSYAGANGSIQDNNGHNPFAAETADFVLDVPNLEANTPLTVSVFRFGTTMTAAPGVITHMPEPSTAVLVGLAGLACGALRKRRAA
jgi:hypothetical protein